MSDSESRTPVKKVKNAVLYSDGAIRLENVRASYPHVFKAQENTGDDGTVSKTFSINVLMPKDTHRAAKDLCVTVINDMLTEKKLGKLAADRKFIKDGDLSAKDENEGMWVVGAREKNRPSLRSSKKDPKTGKAKRLDPEKDAGVIYGGCYVTILIRPWWQDNKYGKRINANLLAVQFLRDGEPFGEGRISEDDIDDRLDAEDDDESGFDEDDDTDGL